MAKWFVVLMLFGCGCGNAVDITLPPISISDSVDGPVPPAVSAMPDTPPPGYRNAGTQVWLVPPPAGDVQRLGQHAELWPTAQRRTDVVSLYAVSASYYEGVDCGIPCGPNTYPAMVAAVPDGMFKWLSDRFHLAIEAGSIKEGICTEDRIRTHAVAPIVAAINNIIASGGRLTYISLDEPFAAGVSTGLRPEYGTTACGLSVAEVARLQKIYNDGIHAVHPDVQIGLIEPYPGFSADRIIEFLTALEQAGVRLPFFHLDFDQPAAVRDDSGWKNDIRRIHEFCRSRGIPFGVILWGWNGRTDEEFAVGYWATARATLQSVGVTEHTVLQSWAESRPGDPHSLKNVPRTVPETVGSTFTGILLETLQFLGIKAR